jgi:hypothetical protein
MSLLFRRSAETATSSSIPPIDQKVPERLETATFAVG